MIKNPIYIKEKKIMARTKKMIATIVIFNMLLLTISLTIFGTINMNIVYANVSDYKYMLTLYRYIGTIEFVLVLIIVPSISASSISGERERQTLEILLTTKMKSADIIFGKFISSLSMIMVVIFSGIPVMALGFVYGGIRIADLILLMFYFLVMGIFAASIGIFCSTILKRSVMSNVATYICLLVSMLGTFIVCFLSNLPAQIDGSGITKAAEYIFYLFLINPLVTFYCILDRQLGNSGMNISIIDEFFSSAQMITESAFIVISIVTQLLIAFGLLRAASKLLIRKK